MSARAVVAHRLPGRVRLSIAERRGDAGYFAALANQFAGLDGVRAVKPNAAAGSIVLEFSGALDELIRRSGAVFELAVGAAEAGSLAPSAPAPAFNLVSGRDINPMFMAGVLFTFMGLVQSLRGRLGVPGLTAFWYATTTFQQAGMPVVTDVVEMDQG